MVTFWLECQKESDEGFLNTCSNLIDACIGADVEWSGESCIPSSDYIKQESLPSICGLNTYWSDTEEKCLPLCQVGEVWKEGVCESLCASGTLFSDGKCVPKCADGESFDTDKDVCVPNITCEAGTKLNESGDKCVQNLTCTEGTKLNETGDKCLGRISYHQNKICFPGNALNSQEQDVVTTLENSTWEEAYALCTSNTDDKKCKAINVDTYITNVVKYHVIRGHGSVEQIQEQHESDCFTFITT